jgi:hypothetical protein
VYEHNGGEVDEKYIKDSEDCSVRPKQVIYETESSVRKLADLILKMAENFNDNFHSIYQPQKGPIQIHTSK